MDRRTFPRKDSAHAAVASNVLARQAQRSGKTITLPVPIELIIEQTYDIEILWDELDEPAGTTILGALSPANRRIVMNTRHEAMFGRWIGPERFTLAHELAHWIYDADDPAQGTLDLDVAPETYCYWRDAPHLADTLRIREINANKLAAHLLLPDDLVRAADIDEIKVNLARTATQWQVSRQMLRIKLENLGLIDDGDRDQLLLPRR